MISVYDICLFDNFICQRRLHSDWRFWDFQINLAFLLVVWRSWRLADMPKAESLILRLRVLAVDATGQIRERPVNALGTVRRVSVGWGRQSRKQATLGGDRRFGYIEVHHVAVLVALDLIQNAAIEEVRRAC